MPLTEEQILEIALKAIKQYCKSQKGDDACTKCMFKIGKNWDYCMFSGPYDYESVIPEDWELDEIQFKK